MKLHTQFLKNNELAQLVRIALKNPLETRPNDALELASECRRRGYYLLEDLLLQAAGKMIFPDPIRQALDAETSDRDGEYPE